jgi:hypothetical protein
MARISNQLTILSARWLESQISWLCCVQDGSNLISVDYDVCKMARISDQLTILCARLLASILHSLNHPDFSEHCIIYYQILRKFLCCRRLRRRCVLLARHSSFLGFFYFTPKIRNVFYTRYSVWHIKDQFVLFLTYTDIFVSSCVRLY